MIQRIQSVYLLLAGIVPALAFFTPYVKLADEGYSLYALSFTSADGNIISHPWGVVVFSFLSIVLAWGAIFCYGNRKKQMRLVNTQTFSLIVVYLSIGAYSYAFIQHHVSLLSEEAVHANVKVVWGTFLPLLSLIFSRLAYRSIKKDDELVKAADRIR